MTRLGDFSAATNKSLAERVGFVCSYPGCNAPTIGPSQESSTSTSNTGMACHIYSAAGNGSARRIKHGADAAELSTIENGIWMCYTHGKKIDTDECTYTPSQLLDWRRLAERHATLRQALGRDVTAEDMGFEPLATATLQLTTPELVYEISEAIKLSAIELVWGAQNAMAVRDLIIEIARNALTHGKASYFKLKINPHSVELSDNGHLFSLSDLKRAGEPRGGSMALSEIGKRAPQVVVTDRRDGEVNVIDLAFTRALGDLVLLNPCSTTIYGDWSSVRAAMDFIDAHPECGTIFLTPKFGTLCYSDLYSIADAIRRKNLSGRDIVLIMQPHSEGIREFITRELPSIRLIEGRLPK
jgi:hypothetical protein